MRKKSKLFIVFSTLFVITSLNVSASLMTHQVKYGETIWGISDYYNVEVNELLSVNSNIEDPTKLFVGDELTLPNNATIHTWSTGINEQRQLLKLINDERENNGLTPLKENPQLSVLAQMKTDDMNENNYFAHKSESYNTVFAMLSLFNIKYNTAGENIAKGQETPEKVFIEWINNDESKKNILNPEYKEIGIGYTNTSTPYWSIIFTD